MKKTGVLLIQLGTPDSPKVRDVRKYLSEFLNDPRVIDLPWLSRKLLVNGIIVPFRAPKSAKIYKELWEYGNGESPLLTYTESLTKLVSDKFKGENVHFHMAMRYQSPSMNSVLEEMRLENYDEIIILPLFPQYASASTGSAIEKALRLMKEWWVIPEIKVINQFYDHPKFIECVVKQTQKFNIADYDHIIFSYHGLPERQVDKVYEKGLCKDHDCHEKITEDNKLCYKAQSYATTRAIASKMGLDESQYTVSFQSRLNEKWLEPFSDKVIEELGKNGAKKLLVFSPAFVADCLETIVEIGTEYQEIFEEFGGEKVQLVESCNDDPVFVDCIESIVKTAL